MKLLFFQVLTCDDSINNNRLNTLIPASSDQRSIKSCKTVVSFLSGLICWQDIGQTSNFEILFCKRPLGLISYEVIIFSNALKLNRCFVKVLLHCAIFSATCLATTFAT